MTLGYILALIVLGLIAGALAKLIMPGPDGGGLIGTIIVGIIGAFVGGFIGQSLGYGGVGAALDLHNILFATLGAIVVLFLYRLVRSRA